MQRRNVLTVQTDSSAGTERLGAAVGERIDAGMCVCLTGPLGAGKTVLVAGLCRGLGVTDAVVSPTFILLETFRGRLPVAHVDLYRLEHERELDEIGVFDYLGTDTVLVAEWGERSPHLLAAADLAITIDPAGGDRRRVSLSATARAGGALEGLAW